MCSTMSASIEKTVTVSEKGGESELVVSTSNEERLDNARVKDVFNFGVRRSEILFKEMDSNWLKVLFLSSIFLLSFASGVDAYLRGTFTAYALNYFEQHSLVALLDLINAVMAAACQLSYSKISDTFGRLEAYLLAVLLYVIGTIIQSQATSVSKYAAGSVFYTLGSTGMGTTLTIFVSDMTSVRWRSFSILTLTYPYLIITWIYGYIIDDLSDRWSWGIGMYAFIYPLSTLPFLSVVAYLYYKAMKKYEWKLAPTWLTAAKKMGYWNFLVRLFWELDILGVLLMIVCLGCLLVPLTIAGGVSEQWSQGKIIAPLVVGFCLIPVFLAYEYYVSVEPVIPLVLFKSRGVWPAIAISFFDLILETIAGNYFYTVLSVAFNESTLSATRISSLGGFVQQIAGFFVGLAVYKFKYLKPFIVAGVCLAYAGYGMVYRYRGGSSSHAGIIASQCMIGLGNGFIVGTSTTITQANVSHDLMARVTGLGLTLYYIGSAIGSSIGGAIWTQKLYSELFKRLQDSDLAEMAYAEPFTFIETYTWETSARQAVVQAYREIERNLIIAVLCVFAIVLACALALQDRKLDDEQSPDVEDVVTSSDLAKFENLSNETTEDDAKINRGFFARMITLRRK